MKLGEYLATCRELSRFCSQNGWIDVLERDGASLVAAVNFDEVLMEGSGCIAGRVSCYGRIRVTLDEQGDVRRMDLL
ncbi:MAG TPA: hypothetical protein ENH08_03985 [Chromatiales bacterium]|nr:hypothetical protein [Chromatiales bacterium]